VADSSDVDAAIVGRLLADATLTSLMPDGVYWDVARHGSTRFVVVSQVFHQEVPMFGATSYEQFTYLVKAVELATSGANIQAAAVRIQTLLHDATFAVTGYGLMNSQRVERVRFVDPDPEDPDIRWQHRGGRFEVTVCPT
jgi:hypothetical protein